MKINSTSENKFKEGEVVCAKIDMRRKLLITRYLDRIYYCQLEQDPSRKNLLYFERELAAVETS